MAIRPPISSVYPTASTTGTIHLETSFAHPFAEPPPRLFALIIGINKYISPNISNLVGAVPDADAVRDYLQKDLRVPSSQIKNLRNSEATRAAIIDGIRDFSLNNEIDEGDAILIYYAGHGGSTVFIPEGWDVGSTGKIELLLPYDYLSSMKDGDPTHGIPDRTLGALLWRLAGRKGNNITVILDCCHSASGTRNYKDPTELVRGIDSDAGNIPFDLDRDVWTDYDEGSERGTGVKAGFTRGGLRSHVLLAACSSEESAIERRSRGLFTQGLLDALTTFEIDKLTYTSLLQQIKPFSQWQHPQCEGFFRDRSIFDGKAPSKHIPSVYYKILRKGEGYEMPDAGEAAGITKGAEFEVYQDQTFGGFLGTVVAHKLSAFSTTLSAKEPIFDLVGDGVAVKSRSGAEERVRIHVADSDGSLMDLVKKIDLDQIQLVEQNDGAEFGIALENEKVVFNIYDPNVIKHGLTRTPYALEPTLEAISPVIHAAVHFFWHRRRTIQTGRRGLAKKVEIKVTDLELKGIEDDDELKPVYIYGPAASDDWRGGKEFDLRTETAYGWKISNSCKIPLYASLFYFDNSDWSITPYYEPPVAQGIVEPPLKGKGYLTVGYGDSGSVPHIFFLREGQNVDVGILKLFLSCKQVNLSHITQPSPFRSESETQTPPSSPSDSSGSRSTSPSDSVQSHSTSPDSVQSHSASPSDSIQSHSTTLLPSAGSDSIRGIRPGGRPVQTRVPEDPSLYLSWDTVEIPVVQRDK